MRGAFPRLIGVPPARLRAFLLLCAASFLALFPRNAQSQQSWEYSPYEIQVWVARSFDPQVNEHVGGRIAREVSVRADSLAGAVWRLSVSPPPAALRHALIDDVAAVTVDDINEHGRDALLGDKLYLVSVNFDPLGYHVAARELDCRTRRFGRLLERRVGQREVLGAVVYSAVAEAFTPLARLEDLTEADTARGVVRMRLRAGGLIYGAGSPAEVNPGDVLQPITRQNDRLGEPKPGGIQNVPWTLLQVAQRDRDILTCNVHSGMRSPFSARGGRRTERLALAVRPQSESTELRLVTRGGSSQPLAGYEVFAKAPAAGDELDASATARRIGQTDWRGLIEITRGEDPLSIVYVKSGGQLLARLPIAPGYEQQVTAHLSDDTPRLRAEGFIVGLQSNVMDLVARREVLASRIRKLIAEKKFDEAQQLVDQFRALDTRDDVLNRLDQRSGVTSPDRRVQAKIDKLFADTRQMLASYLDPREADVLLSELNAARTGGGAQGGSE